jgi:hypothetical protein
MPPLGTAPKQHERVLEHALKIGCSSATEQHQLGDRFRQEGRAVQYCAWTGKPTTVLSAPDREQVEALQAAFNARLDALPKNWKPVKTQNEARRKLLAWMRKQLATLSGKPPSPPADPPTPTIEVEEQTPIDTPKPQAKAVPVIHLPTKKPKQTKSNGKEATP